MSLRWRASFPPGPRREPWPWEWADPSLDVIHICTPNVTHAKLAAAALGADKHVVVEKPLALNSDEARHLVALGRAANARAVGAH